jgi:hypothetical protein
MATPKSRTTPGINQSTVNKINKNVSNTSTYFGNVGKEFKDFAKTYGAVTEMANTSGPGTDAAASRLRNKQDKDMGQLAGAILQGRRYDTNGKQIK